MHAQAEYDALKTLCDAADRKMWATKSPADEVAFTLLFKRLGSMRRAMLAAGSDPTRHDHHSPDLRMVAIDKAVEAKHDGGL